MIPEWLCNVASVFFNAHSVIKIRSTVLLLEEYSAAERYTKSVKIMEDSLMWLPSIGWV